MGNAEYDILRIPPNGYQTSIDAYAGREPGPGRPDLQHGQERRSPEPDRPASASTSINPDSVNYPRTFTTSLSVAQRIPWQQVLEVAYVGTFGRHLLNTRQSNVDRAGDALERDGRQLRPLDPGEPPSRSSADVINTLRPYPALGDVTYWEYNGTSNYHSLQATLSRQTGRRFQYFLTYTFGKGLGTAVPNGEYDDIDPFEPRVAHLRRPGLRPDPHPERLLQLLGPRPHQRRAACWGDRERLAALWHLDLGERHPDLRRLHRRHQLRRRRAGLVGHSRPSWAIGTRTAWAAGSTMTPVFTCDPARWPSLGDKILDINCLRLPGLRRVGVLQPQPTTCARPRGSTTT